MQYRTSRRKEGLDEKIRDGDAITGKDIDGMYEELLEIIAGLKSEHLKKLCEAFFVDDKEFAAAFKNNSAAKSVHHGFVGGLLEHTLSVTRLCEFYTTRYPMLKKDLLLAAAMLLPMVGCAGAPEVTGLSLKSSKSLMGFLPFIFFFGISELMP